MKLIYIHIPKTAGSSINDILQRTSQGVWLKNNELESTDPEDLWGLDYLSGHFTRQELLSWVARNQLSLEKVKVMTVIRHPLDQLQSNLSFPFELSERGQAIEEPWMKDALFANPHSANDLYTVLEKHPWLLNLQWQFLVNGSYLEEALDQIDHVAIFPGVSSAINYASQVLKTDSPDRLVHVNPSRQKFVRQEVFAHPPLKALILRDHSLDIKLFSEVVCRRMLESGLEALAPIFPSEPEQFLKCWIARQSTTP